MTPEERGPQEPDKPVVRDRRRIDPTTGEVRRAAEASPGEAGQAAQADATPVDGVPAADGGAPAGDGGALAAAKAESAELSDQLARRTADLFNVQQEYNAYVRRAKAAAGEQHLAGVAAVAEALLGVLDEIELARQHGDLGGPLGTVLEKLEATLDQRFGVQRFGAVGEEFDPAIHEALMHSTEEGATATAVSQVLQPGYRIGERVLRAARVAVTGPQ